VTKLATGSDQKLLTIFQNQEITDFLSKTGMRKKIAQNFHRLLEHGGKWMESDTALIAV